MARQYRKFDQDFQQGAVRLVFETGKPIAQVARELGINDGTLGNWCARERRRQADGDAAVSESEHAELERLRKENVELRMQRDDALMFVKRHHEVILDRSVVRS